MSVVIFWLLSGVANVAFIRFLDGPADCERETKGRAGAFILGPVGSIALMIFWVLAIVLEE